MGNILICWEREVTEWQHQGLTFVFYQQRIHLVKIKALCIPKTHLYYFKSSQSLFTLQFLIQTARLIFRWVWLFAPLTKKTIEAKH